MRAKSIVLCEEVKVALCSPYFLPVIFWDLLPLNLYRKYQVRQLILSVLVGVDKSTLAVRPANNPTNKTFVQFYRIFILSKGFLFFWGGKGLSSFSIFHEH